MKSNKILGILLLLIYVCVCTALLNDAFIKPYNLQNMLRLSSMSAIVGLGAMLVIVTGGIDLSMGSLIGLIGCAMTMSLHWLLERPAAKNLDWFSQMIGWELIGVALFLMLYRYLVRGRIRGPGLVGNLLMLGLGLLFLLLRIPLISKEWGNWLSVLIAVKLSLYISLHLGILHGILVTYVKLQPFIATLCGLMCYRGLTRFFTSDQTQGLGTDFNDSLRLLAIGKPCTMTFVALCAGSLFLLFGFFRLLLPRAERKFDDRCFGALFVALSACVMIVASSRYWDGWEIKTSGDTLFTWLGNEFKFFTLKLGADAVARPATIMAYAVYPLLACALGIVTLHARQVFGRESTRQWGIILLHSLLPLAGIFVATFGLFKVVGWIGGEAIDLWKPEETQYAGLSYTSWKSAGVFGLMAVLTGCVMVVYKTWIPRLGVAGRILWTATVFFAVMWLLSKTEIHKTIVQTPFFVMAVVATGSAVFLNRSVWGRYLLALGNNEDAARYSGINTSRMTIVAYVLCALCGGIGGILFMLDANSVEPSGFGNSYELYAIAAAVLGGCSLRGGEASVLGVVIGAMIIRVLQNAPDMIGVPHTLEQFTVGIALLIGVMVDETARRIAARRDRLVQSA